VLFRWAQCNHRGGRRARLREGGVTTEAKVKVMTLLERISEPRNVVILRS
jgi:hypothetical protein